MTSETMPKLTFSVQVLFHATVWRQHPIQYTNLLPHVRIMAIVSAM